MTHSINNTKKRLEYDVIIVGAGFVGASVAHGVKQLGLSCAILDKGKISTGSQKEIALDNRGIALSDTSKKILQQLELWHLLEKNIFPIQTVHVSKQGCFGITKLQSKHADLAALGYLVGAGELIKKLQGKLFDAEIDVFSGIENLKLISNSKNKVQEVEFICKSKSKETIECTTKLVIAADGSNSLLRAAQGIQVDTYDYNEVALVSNVHLLQEHNNVAYERFTDIGTIALLPFGNKRMKFVWTLGKEKADNLLSLTKEELIQEVQKRFGYRLGKLKSVDEVSCFPLEKIKAESLSGERLVIIGNAANTMHPIAAQGLNLGLRDVDVLIKTLSNAKKQNEDIGCSAVLSKYENLRQQDHSSTQNFTHKVHQMFTSSNLLSNLTCSLGLSIFNLCFPLKKMVINKGLGR